MQIMPNSKQFWEHANTLRFLLIGTHPHSRRTRADPNWKNINLLYCSRPLHGLLSNLTAVRKFNARTSGGSTFEKQNPNFWEREPKCETTTSQYHKKPSRMRTPITLDSKRVNSTSLRARERTMTESPSPHEKAPLRVLSA